jgi:hypothetical protein
VRSGIADSDRMPGLHPPSADAADRRRANLNACALDEANRDM